MSNMSRTQKRTLLAQRAKLEKIGWSFYITQAAEGNTNGQVRLDNVWYGLAVNQSRGLRTAEYVDVAESVKSTEVYWMLLEEVMEGAVAATSYKPKAKAKSLKAK